MERDLSVNLIGQGGDPHRTGEDLKVTLTRVLSAGAPPQPSQGEQGPCLYLGEAGQRCSRRAVEGGFCRSHQGQRDHLDPQAVEAKATKRSATPAKVLAASIGIIGILLPYVIDLVREVLRWIYSR
jgi:hypothetical protein